MSVDEKMILAVRKTAQTEAYCTSLKAFIAGGRASLFNNVEVAQSVVNAAWTFYDKDNPPSAVSPSGYEWLVDFAGENGPVTASFEDGKFYHKYGWALADEETLYADPSILMFNARGGEGSIHE